MKTVWCVFNTRGGEEELEIICSTKEKAESFVDAVLRKNPWMNRGYYDIEEVTLDVAR